MEPHHPRLWQAPHPHPPPPPPPSSSTPPPSTAPPTTVHAPPPTSVKPPLPLSHAPPSASSVKLPPQAEADADDDADTEDGPEEYLIDSGYTASGNPAQQSASVQISIHHPAYQRASGIPAFTSHPPSKPSFHNSSVGSPDGGKSPGSMDEERLHQRRISPMASTLRKMSDDSANGGGGPDDLAHQQMKKMKLENQMEDEDGVIINHAAVASLSHIPEILKSIIECGEDVKQQDGTLVRLYLKFNPFFGKEVEVFYALSDPDHRPLFRPHELAKKFGIHSSRVRCLLHFSVCAYVFSV
jgi:hypothetical protein